MEKKYFIFLYCMIYAIGMSSQSYAEIQKDAFADTEACSGYKSSSLEDKANQTSPEISNSSILVDDRSGTKNGSAFVLTLIPDPVEGGIVSSELAPITQGTLDWQLYSVPSDIYPPHPNNATEFDNHIDNSTEILNGNIEIESYNTGLPNVPNILNWQNASELNSLLGSDVDDHFALVIKGTFIPKETGIYRFTIAGDDAVDCFIDDTNVVNHYGGHSIDGLGIHIGDIELVAGENYTIRVRQQEHIGGEGLRLFWRKPSQLDHSQWFQDAEELFSYAISKQEDVSYRNDRSISEIYNADDIIKVTAAANDGWGFLTWTDNSGNILSDEPEYFFTMPSNDLTLTANFANCLLTIIVNPDEGGRVTGSGFYNHSDQVNVFAESNPGWFFENWTDEDGVVLSTSQAFSFEMPSSNQTIFANFQTVMFAGGSGTPDNPFMIETLTQLQAIAHPDNLSKHFIQTVNIDATETEYWNNGEGWVPIGSQATHFTGKYNGQGYTIDGLYINRPDEDYQGLFGYASYASLIGLGIRNAMVIGYRNIGGLLGYNDHTIINQCFVEGDVSGYEDVGGVVGNLFSYFTDYRGSLRQVFFGGSVTGNTRVGGLVGDQSLISLIQNSFSQGVINGHSSVGGLVGSMNGSAITNNSYSAAIVNGSAHTGGLAGSGGGAVNNSFWDIEVSGQEVSAGGVGLTTQAMNTYGVYYNAGWDFAEEDDNGIDYIWGINETGSDNDGYPFLVWQDYSHYLVNPAVKILPIVNITMSSAIVERNIHYWGETDMVLHGLCWNTSGSPTVDDFLTEEEPSAEMGIFTTEITGLEPVTTYYLRVYIVQDGDIWYSDEIIFSTVSVDAIAPDGSGISGDPYIIANLGNLFWFSLNEHSWDKHFLQVADIDASEVSNWYDGTGWMPIGYKNEHDLDYPFSGSYNGQGYTIDGLYINRPDNNNQGLFGFVVNNGTLSNIGLSNVNISGNNMSGSLVGHMQGNLISNCFADGSVHGKDQVGGLAGYSDGSQTSQSFYNGHVTGINHVGGLVGDLMYANVNNSFSKGEVVGNNGIGGLVGHYHGCGIAISNSYSYSIVSGNSNVGGLFGGGGNVYNSFWDIDVSGQSASAGGVGLTTQEMKTYGTYYKAGWDFVEENDNGTNFIWGIDETGEDHGGYPFLTWQGYTHNLLHPVMKLYPITDITMSSVMVKRNIHHWGETDMVPHGICWNTMGSPTVNDYLTEEGPSSETGIFTTEITDLNPLTTYYIRAYVIQDDNIWYSDEISFSTVSVDAIAPSGLGTSEDPYVIANLGNLFWFSINEDSWNKHFIQVADINVSEVSDWYNGTGWVPIGYIRENDEDSPFSGTYNGQGYTIDGLFINRPDGNKQGFFGLTHYSNISNLLLVNSTVTGNYNVGLIVGLGTGLLERCGASGIVNGYSYVGGLSGHFGGLISECSFNGFVNGNSRIGGLIGHIHDTNIANSYSIGSVNGYSQVGGLVGSTFFFSITNSYSSTSITGDYVTGGLIGSGGFIAEIFYSFWDKELSGQFSSSGTYDTEGIGLTTQEMKTFGTYFNAGWDFMEEDDNGTEYIWGIDETGEDNDGYPFLAWQGYSHNLVPILAIEEISDITPTSAKVHSIISQIGNSEIIQHGVCWNTSGTPTISDDKTELVSTDEIGGFISNLDDLESGTSYHVRAYATTGNGTYYSDETVFQTICAPDWVPVENLQFNMQLIGQILIDDELSLNPHDIVGAFVDGECRGIASPQPQNNGLLFLTIGSNVQFGETVELVIWDSENCEPCETYESFQFENFGQIGTLADPFIIECGFYDMDLSFGQGFTWFSLGLVPESGMALDHVFADLSPCVNDRIIGQTQFASFSGTEWIGSLTHMDPERKFVMELCTAQEINIIGSPAEIQPMEINAGFYWLGYTPQECMPVNVALESIISQANENDRIIGQTAFASFSGTEWIGSLTQMCPGKGYVIDLAEPVTLLYPENSKASVVSSGNDIKSPTGNYPKENLKHTMTLLANLITHDNGVSINEQDVIYAYVDGECRGMANPIQDHNGRIFMNIGSNIQEGEQIHFKAWIDDSQELFAINQSITYQSLNALGSYQEPIALTLGHPVGVDDTHGVSWHIGDPYPNPFRNLTIIPIITDSHADVSIMIYNSLGQLVYHSTKEVNGAGSHFVNVDGSGLSEGIYHYRVSMRSMDRVTKQKTGRVVIL